MVPHGGINCAALIAVPKVQPVAFVDQSLMHLLILPLGRLSWVRSLCQPLPIGFNLFGGSGYRRLDIIEELCIYCSSNRFHPLVPSTVPPIVRGCCERMGVIKGILCFGSHTVPVPAIVPHFW